VAQALSFYETVNANGVMRMIAQPDGFTVPAGESLVLEPGEKHLMLENLRATSLGDTIHPYPHLLHWENKKESFRTTASSGSASRRRKQAWPMFPMLALKENEI